jgi:hypothetical protein
VALDGSRPLRASARGVRLHLVSAEHARTKHLSPARNDFAPLAHSWSRTEGAWSEHGAWDLGAPLPPAEGTGSPPGWLLGNLPQGVPILVGRARPAAGEKAAVWVRCAGP